MSWIKEKYYDNRNGIIITLLFHIIVFTTLNITQFKTKNEYIESEILIDFPEELIEQVNQETTEKISTRNGILNTNQASNISSKSENKTIDEAFQQELEQARNLVKDVSNQLSKEIPTVDDLRIPEETTEGLNPDSIMKKLYNGDSNVEYFLESRYHLRLPIPVYLSQYGGKVKVNIIVDSSGKVIKAEPESINNFPEQILSFAKTAALRTQFNAKTTDNKPQRGYITYNFIAQ